MINVGIKTIDYLNNVYYTYLKTQFKKKVIKNNPQVEICAHVTTCILHIKRIDFFFRWSYFDKEKEGGH